MISGLLLLLGIVLHWALSEALSPIETVGAPVINSITGSAMCLPSSYEFCLLPVTLGLYLEPLPQPLVVAFVRIKVIRNGSPPLAIAQPTCSACIATFSLFSCLQTTSSIHIAIKHSSNQVHSHPNPTALGLGGLEIIVLMGCYLIPIKSAMPVMAGSVWTVFMACTELGALPAEGIQWGDISAPDEDSGRTGFGGDVKAIVEGKSYVVNNRFKYIV